MEDANMDDYDLSESAPGDETPSAPQAEQRSDAPDWVAKELRELRDENKQLRTERTRLRLSKQYGDEVLDLVPPTLTLKEQEELATKLAERLAGQQPNPTAEAKEEPTPEAEEEPANPQLAAVAGQAPGSAAQAYERLSAKEIAQLGKTDPVAAVAAIQRQYENGPEQLLQPFRDR